MPARRVQAAKTTHPAGGRKSLQSEHVQSLSADNTWTYGKLWPRVGQTSYLLWTRQFDDSPMRRCPKWHHVYDFLLTTKAQRWKINTATVTHMFPPESPYLKSC